MLSDIVFVRGEDWTGLYVEGKLVRENHMLEPEDVLRDLGIGYARIDYDPPYGGSLPRELKDLEGFGGP